MDWFWIITASVAVLSVYLTFKPRNYDPDKVLIDHGDTVLLCMTPAARANSSLGKKVSKSSIVRIQYAVKSQVISLFTESGNAIDIFVPHQKHVEPILENAKEFFVDAELITVDN